MKSAVPLFVVPRWSDDGARRSEVHEVRGVSSEREGRRELARNVILRSVLVWFVSFQFRRFDTIHKQFRVYTYPFFVEPTTSGILNTFDEQQGSNARHSYHQSGDVYGIVTGEAMGMKPKDKVKRHTSPRILPGL